MTRAGLIPFSAAAVVGLAVLTCNANAEDQCFREPSPIESLDNTNEHLILRSPRNNYVLEAACIVINRRTFGKTLDFVVLNRFPSDTQVSAAYIFAKSDRTLTTSPPIKISLSRGDGWFLESNKGQTPAPGGKMNFEPFQGTIENWNTAHSEPGGPGTVDDRLKVQWHAFATNIPALPSTVPIDYWQIAEPFDVAHNIRTNYLIRFAVNTDSTTNSLVPFQVYIQQAVKEVDLTLFSNIDALSGTYRFIIK
jgi:hypothetical protein